MGLSFFTGLYVFVHKYIQRLINEVILNYYLNINLNKK